MAEKDGGSREPAGAARVRKSSGRLQDTCWYSACRDAERRAELHSTQSPSPEFPTAGRGFVYIMRDALGDVKVGITEDLPMRLMVVRRKVARNRRPVMLSRAVEVPSHAMGRIERRTHKLLDAYRVSPVEEWFSVGASAASRALNRAVAQLRQEKGWNW